jgi:hypothetical protein
VPVVSEKSAEGRHAARQLPNLAGRINKIHAELSQLPVNIQAALHLRVVFRARLNHDEAMAWLRILPRMLEDLAEDWGRPWPKPKSKQSLAGRPSLERESLVIDVFYEAVEEFIGKRLPSPRSKNDNKGLQLVRLLVQRIFPLAATEESGIPTMLGHFHKRWLRRKKQTAAT